MNLLKGLEINSNKTLTTNGAITNSSTLNNNLDYFLSARKNSNGEIELFKRALIENPELAVKNLLYKLDIRNGQGLRTMFKKGFKTLISVNSDKGGEYDDYIMTIINLIPELGRYDYMLEGLNTQFHDYIVKQIYKQLMRDLRNCEDGKPISLLAKWLPSHRIGKKNNPIAKSIISHISRHIDTNFNEKKYRKSLSKLRSYLDIVEKNLTLNKSINFENVPSKAQLKYRNTFYKKYELSYKDYIQSLKDAKTKAKANNLFMDEILEHIQNAKNSTEIELLNAMWRDQDFQINGMEHNVLPVIDTSASMEGRPMNCALALGILLSERNTGLFKDHFITFSRKAKLVKIKGDTLYDKINSFECIVEDTNIDSVFELILKTMLDNNLTNDDLPSHIVIVSDMNFNMATDHKKTNFEYWKDLYGKSGFKLPKIIFWDVSESWDQVYPVTKFEENVAMISGYSKNIFNNILTLENLAPINYMIEELSQYDKYFE